jgi:hypothetical protein
MWRIPILNLCLLLVVITILALHHSASFFAPFEGRFNPARDRGHSYAVTDPVGSDGRSGSSLMTALGALSELWQRSMIMKQWMLEYEATYWEKLRAARGAESDLVEARFHVSNAQVLGAAIGDKQRAKVELGRADRDLKKALPLVADDTLLTLETISKELSAAKLDLERAGTNTYTSDERIKIDLDHMISLLHRKRR